MNTDTCIVYLHGNDWDGVRSRQRYLLEALSEFAPVIYLDGGWDSSWGRVTVKHPTPNVTVLRGFIRVMVSFRVRNFEFPSYVWARLHLGWLRRKYRRIVFIDCENWLRPYRFISHDCLIYDCIDPLFDRNPEVVADFDRCEAEILNASDAVLVTAEALKDHAAAIAKRVYLVNNACAPEEYSQELMRSALRPEWWPQNSQPVAVYLGAIDWRFDFRFVEAAARNFTNVAFVLAGAIHPDVEARCAELRSMPNVVMPGRVSIEDGRYLLANCTIGLIPFIPGEMSDAINPVKMYAYALAGKPIAGSAVRELLLRPAIAETGSSPEEFVGAVVRALERAGDPSTAQQLQQFALANTWKQRAKEVWDIIQSFPEREANIQRSQ